MNDTKKTYYNIQVYNSYDGFPIAMTNVNVFEFEKLLSHPNPRVNAFNFIVITRCVEQGNTTTIKPIILIYDKNEWKVKSENIENTNTIKTYCSCVKEALDFNGKLIKLACNSQTEIINMFNIISKVLITKSKIKNKILTKNK